MTVTVQIEQQLRRPTEEVGNVHCHVCSTIGGEAAAVASCRGCGAGLCLPHAERTSARVGGALLVTCDHDTLSPARPAPASRRGSGLRAVAL